MREQKSELQLLRARFNERFLRIGCVVSQFITASLAQPRGPV